MSPDARADLSGEDVPGRVYWMESSKRGQARAWLRRGDLAPAERLALEDFVRRYRTDAGLTGGERREMLALFERLQRRFRT